MFPFVSRRAAGGAAALVLVGASLFASTGTAFAAITRFIYVGPDPSFSDATNGTLTFTDSSTNQASSSTIYVKNIDTQTLTHVVVTFLVSQDPVSIVGTYGPNASSCQPSADSLSLACDFGALKKGETRQFSLVVTSSAAGKPTFLGQVYFNESTNPNGGNQQINTLTGTLNVATTTCDSASTFIAPGKGGTLLPDTGDCGLTVDGQRSSLTVPVKKNQAYLLSVNDANTATGCGSLKCIGNVVDGTVNGGAAIDPYLLWTIFYSNSVIGNINPKQVAFIHDTTVILAGNKGLCSTSTAVDCQEPYQVTSTGVFFFVRTATNGVIKGAN